MKVLQRTFTLVSRPVLQEEGLLRTGIFPSFAEIFHFIIQKKRRAEALL